MRSSRILGKAKHNLVPNRASVRDIYAHIRVPKEVREKLPNAAANPYRKRPVAVTYDHDEYFSYLMPSERAFLYSGSSLLTSRYGCGGSIWSKEESQIQSSDEFPPEPWHLDVLWDDRNFIFMFTDGSKIDSQASGTAGKSRLHWYGKIWVIRL